MTEWHPTPAHEEIGAVRLAGDSWEPCRYRDLRKGDIFRATYEGRLIHPLTHEPNDECVSIAEGDAEKLDPLGSTGQWYGWGVPLSVVYSTMEDLRRKGLS